ncbi:MAG: hypothetical protein EOP88_00780 [Verrucomicrobiaceae bacterium]|nr:MAG: hypothetical protein EOP88_00780 [Verrucomicrobiaceae bacterium]
MKSKTAFLTTAATLALFGAANGQVVIDITGSTAGRSTVHAQIQALLTGESFGYYMVNGSTQGAAGSADSVIYKGGTLLVGGVQVPVTVRTFWAGSASGVDYVSNQVQLDNKFLATTVSVNGQQIPGNQAALIANGSLAPASAETVSEFGFSDVKQAATTHQSSPLAEQTDMFVIPFKWVRTETLTGVSNITDQMVRAMYTAGGETPKSLFTGVAADSTSFVYSVGRDNDSGTRITALAETGAGAFSILTQWGFTTAGSGTTVTLSSPTELFDGGYASGGSVATILGGTGFNAIGYVGISDATNAINNFGVELTFNGVPFSVANVKNGSYTFWSKYQAIRKQTLTGPAASLFASLKTSLINLPTVDPVGTTVKLTDMAVDRAADGADVLPK